MLPLLSVYSSRIAKGRKGETSLGGHSHNSTSPQHREEAVKKPTALVNAHEEDMRGACYGSCGCQRQQQESLKDWIWNGN